MLPLPVRQWKTSLRLNVNIRPISRHTLRCRLQRVTCKAADRCHYEVLGVQHTASADDIKRAFRKLALKLHPDVNTAPDAADAFTAAKSAYEALSDPQQRAAYNKELRKNNVHTRSRASSWQPGANSSSGRSRRSQSSNTHTAYVVYDFGGELEEEELDAAAGAGFHGWYAQSGSWQSSWEANRKKRQKQQQQQQQAQWRQQQQKQAVTELLQQQDMQTLSVVAHVFGEELEHLSGIEELLDLIAGLELLQQEGVQLDASIFEARADRQNRRAASGRNPSGAEGRAARSRSSKQQQATQAGPSSSRRSRGAAGNSTSGTQQPGPTGSGSRRRQKASSGSQHQSNGTRGSRSGKLPRFEELSFEELFAVMQDQTQPKVAQAAREWASSYRFADPRLAADVEAFLTVEYLSGDWDDGSILTGMNVNSSSSPWQHVSFDYDEYAERQKYKAKPGSARDYVRYEIEDDDDDLADVRQFIRDEFGCVEVEDVELESAWESSNFDDVVYVRF